VAASSDQPRVWRCEADVQRHVASLPAYVRELLDDADWAYWRAQVNRYQYAHRPHAKSEDRRE